MQSPELPWYEQANLDIQEFSAAGIRTFAVVEGRPDAFPVIFLHGLPGGAFIWADVIKALGRRRLAIAPDLPGWGRSFARFAPTAPDFSIEGLRKWLNGLLVAQAVNRFDLVAHGSAAWPAVELLISDPSRVRRLALVSARLWESGERAGIFQRLLGTAKWSQKRISHWLDESSHLTPQAREQNQPLFDRALGSEKEPRTSPLLSESGFPARIPEYRSALAAYKGAELLIWGEKDPQSPPERITELTATLPDPEVHLIANAGHFPMLDAPGEVIAIFREFLSE